MPFNLQKNIYIIYCPILHFRFFSEKLEYLDTSKISIWGWVGFPVCHQLFLIYNDSKSNAYSLVISIMGVFVTLFLM